MIEIEEEVVDYSRKPTKREKSWMKHKKKWRQAMARRPGKNSTCARCPWAFSDSCIKCEHKKKE